MDSFFPGPLTHFFLLHFRDAQFPSTRQIAHSGRKHLCKESSVPSWQRRGTPSQYPWTHSSAFLQFAHNGFNSTGDGDGVAVAVDDGGGEGLLVAVGVGGGEALAVEDGVGGNDGLAVAVEVGIGDGVGGGVGVLVGIVEGSVWKHLRNDTEVQ